MKDDSFFVNIEEYNGMKFWEMDDIPIPNDVNLGMARYNGQRYVEQLLKVMNKKAFLEHEDNLKVPFYLIFESSLEQGVENEARIQWNDKFYYARLSWTSYSWKLPHEIKRRSVQIDISKVGASDKVERIQVPLKKIADDGGEILISPKIVSKLDLRNGNSVNIKIKFSN